MKRKRVVVTRAAGQAEDLARELEKRGLTPVVVPVLEIRDPWTWAPVDAALRRLASFRAIVFTSANAVDRFFTRFYDVLGTCDLAALPEGTRAFAVGPKTAEALQRIGIRAAGIPSEFRGDALAPVIGDVRGERVLLPRAQDAREELATALRHAGATVEAITTYRTSIPDGARVALAAALPADAISFASPSAVSHVVELLEGPEAARLTLAETVLAAIGPTTAERIEELRLGASIVAKEATAASLADALAKRLRSPS